MAKRKTYEVESDVQRDLITWLSDRPLCKVTRINNQTGEPDLIACVNGLYIGIEVKLDKEGGYSLRLDQQITLKLIGEAKGRTAVVDKNNIEEFKNWVRMIEKAEVKVIHHD